MGAIERSGWQCFFAGSVGFTDSIGSRGPEKDTQGRFANITFFVSDFAVHTRFKSTQPNAFSWHTGNLATWWFLAANLYIPR